MSTGLKVSLASFVTGMAQTRERVAAAAVPACQTAMEHIVGDAQERAPIATGELQNSDQTLPAKIVGNKVECEGGFGAAHAAAVHENTRGAKFNTAANPLATDHFLELAMTEGADDAQRYVAERIRRAGA